MAWHAQPRLVAGSFSSQSSYQNSSLLIQSVSRQLAAAAVKTWPGDRPGNWHTSASPSPSLSLTPEKAPLFIHLSGDSSSFFSYLMSVIRLGHSSGSGSWLWPSSRQQHVNAAAFGRQRQQHFPSVYCVGNLCVAGMWRAGSEHGWLAGVATTAC